MVVLDADLHGVAEGGEADDFDVGPFVEAHFQEALKDEALAPEGKDDGFRAGTNVCQGMHGGTRYDGAAGLGHALGEA